MNWRPLRGHSIAISGFRGRIQLVASGPATGSLSRPSLELFEDVLDRLVVADRVGNPAGVVLRRDNDGAIAQPSSMPQTPTPHSAFVHSRSID
jgi:hypothetical protein